MRHDRNDASLSRNPWPKISSPTGEESRSCRRWP